MSYTESSRLTTPGSESGKDCPVRTNLEKGLVILTIVVVAIGIGLSIALASVYTAQQRQLRHLKEHNENICYSPACVTEASTLLKSLDTDVDPCSDFYTFACGKWIKNTHLFGHMQSRFTSLSKSIILKVKEILEELKEKTADRPEHVQKISLFYKSCMNKASRDEEDAVELKKDLTDFGGWPLINSRWKAEDFNWKDLLVKLFKKGYISNMLFTVSVGIHPNDTTKTLIKVMHPSLGLNSKMFYSDVFSEVTDLYQKTIFKLAKLLKPDIDDVTASIQEAFEIEKQIADSIPEIDRDPRHRYHIKTLGNLTTFTPKIPWKEIFEGFLPQNTQLKDSDDISITSLSMLENLNTLLGTLESEEGKKKLANYMFYRVVLFAAHHLSVEYYSLIAELNEKQGHGRLPAWDVCLQSTMKVFHIPVAAIYVTKFLDNSTKSLLGTLLGDLKDALKEDVKSADWLDEKTKEQALLKVNNIKAIIGYENEIMNKDEMNKYYESLTITEEYFKNVKAALLFQHEKSMEGLNMPHTRLRWPEIANLLIANAYYRPDQNAIIIPVGILQDPFFLAGRPNYINYGSLGMIIGHELTHAFDKIGSYYDNEGNFKNWWSDGSFKKFENKTECYKKQYSNYTVPEAQQQINGTLTLEENIADNGGLKAAYHAYIKMLNREKTEKSLPGLKYNEKQMFWISFASIWCKKETEHHLKYSLKHFYHSPSKFRVIGSLSNIKEFSDDFKCNASSKMNPQSKCLLWK